MCEFNGSLEGREEVTLGVDTERHRNQGTIKLLVEAERLKPRVVGQKCDCCTFATDTRSEAEFKKVSCAVNT